MATIVQIACSKDELFALDDEGDIWSFDSGTRTWRIMPGVFDQDGEVNDDD